MRHFVTSQTEMPGEVKTGEMECPHCGKILDRAAHPLSLHPEPGDVTVCVGCLKVCRFVQRGLLLALQPGADTDLMPGFRAKLRSIRYAREKME